PFGCQFGNVTTGMSFNSELSGAKLQEIKEPYETVLIFEVEQPAANLSGEYTARPKSSGPPFMFGERRDWFFVTIKGKGNLDEFGEENSRGGALKIIERESQ
ncbi:MAG TPA: hypothetical protein VM328_07280, partial [Fimbriimonadaceae bacterium]|nr:hypothetical protein [Fimbriimonadaceae bacterium]